MTSVYIPRSDGRPGQGRKYRALEDIIRGLEGQDLGEMLERLEVKLLKAGLELDKDMKDSYEVILNRMLAVCQKAKKDLDSDFELMLEDLSDLLYALTLMAKEGSREGYFDLDELSDMAYFSYFEAE